MNIIKYLKTSIPSVCIILVLLIVQASCDLALPTYTSEIVDTGIAKQGIDEQVPETLRESELERLLLFVEDEDAAFVRACYEQNGNTVGDDKILSLHADKEDRETLQQLLSDPMTLFGVLYASEETAEEQSDADTTALGSMAEMEQAIAVMQNPQTSKQQRIQLMESLLDGFGDLRDSMSEQMSAQYILAEYKAQNIDMDQYQMSYLVSTGGKMLAVALIAMAASVLVGLIASRVAAGTAMNLRVRVFNKVVHFSNADLDRFSTASLITRNTNDIQQVQMVIVLLLRMVLYAPIIGIGGIIKVINTDLSMSWIIVAAVAAIVVIVLFLFLIAMPKFRLMQTLVDKLNLVSREILTGLPVIRAFSAEKHEEKRFDQANRELADTQLFTNRVMTLMMPAMTLIMNFVSVAIIWFGGHKIDEGTIQVGQMMAFMTYTMQIVMAFLMLTMVSIMLPRAGVAAKRIEEVLHTKSSIQDADADEKPSGKGVVEFEDVSFKYPGADHNVIEHINFRAKPGQATAIIGSTGSGKSTIVNLIPRFYDVTEGAVKIDGVDVRNMKRKQIRKLLGFVPQKGILFSGTIASNVRFGNQEASDELVKKAVAIAQAKDFVEEKRLGYESAIAQGGTNVSGGQKQRLAIARAIAKEPKIYVFDDSFSALDYKTDVALRQALKQETKDSTVLIVAQRISTILQAEQIIVLDEGKMVGKGTHQELMQTCEVYRQIAQSQLSPKEIEQSMRGEQVDTPDGKEEDR